MEELPVAVLIAPGTNGAAIAVPGAPRYSARQAVALAVILGAAFMVVLDFFIVLVAIPSIQRELAASSAALQLVVAGYAIANAAGLIAGGRLGDIFGRRTLFTAGMAMFVLASLGCALATTPSALVTMRFAQGLAGAMLQPQVLALLSSTFEGALRQKAFAAYAMSMGLAGVCGQLIGGALIEANWLDWGWRWCFLINLPIGLSAIVIGVFVLPRPQARPSDSSVDLVGMVLAGIAMTSLIWALTYGRETASSATNAALITAALTAGGLLWLQQRWLERSGGAPMLRLSLFRSDGFVIGMLTVLTFYSGIASFHLVIGVYLQTTMHLSPLQSGLMFACVAASFVVTSMKGPRLQEMLGKFSMVYGACILVAGHVMQIVVAATGGGMLSMIPALIVEGVGIGLVMAPLVARALLKVPAAHSGVGSGVLATMQSAGNALGVAVITFAFLAAREAQRQSAGPDAGFIASMLGLCVVTTVTGFLSYRLSR